MSTQLVSDVTHRRMAGNVRSNTIPEQKVRRILRKIGYPGYRLDWKKAPGRPDIAYPGKKIAIFVNGCFWHSCPICNKRIPKTNGEFWETKFQKTKERDERNRKELEELGWKVIVVWEHQLKDDQIDDTERYLYATISELY